MSGPAHHPVFLHGFAGSSESWGEALVDGLVVAGMAPVLVDLPGHGREAVRTATGGITLDATVEIIAEAGVWPTDLVGYSLGARVALHFAAAHPQRVRRLVLESGSPGLATPDERAARRGADAALAARIVDEGIETFVAYWESQSIFETQAGLPPEARARQRAIRLGNDPSSLAEALRSLGTGALPSLWEELPRIATPTLLLVGARDRKFVDIAQRMASGMADARVVIVPDAGHSVHLERPAAWVEAVANFLAE